MRNISTFREKGEYIWMLGLIGIRSMIYALLNKIAKFVLCQDKKFKI